MRVLHVVGGMDVGGIESWLMQVLRRTDRGRIEMDFLVSGDDAVDKEYAYDEELIALGARLLRCRNISRPWVYGPEFKRLLRDGRYDVVHSHVDHYCGYVLRLAAQVGVPMRVAHSHLDMSEHRGVPSAMKQAYASLMKRWIAQYTTHGFATSDRAAAWLFGSEWRQDSRWRLLYCGIDSAPFGLSVHRGVARAELGIPQESFVVGHVGRFTEPKNHIFLLEIAAEVARHDPDMRLLLVGTGALLPRIEAKARDLGIYDKTVFAGVRSDVPHLMMGAMDVFAFPSLFEGLGLGLIEAQAAGLPCVASSVVPCEANVVQSLVTRLSLNEPAYRWAEALLAHRTVRNDLPTRAEALAAVRHSLFEIAVSVQALSEFYLAKSEAKPA